MRTAFVSTLALSLAILGCSSSDGAGDGDTLQDTRVSGDTRAPDGADGAADTAPPVASFECRADGDCPATGAICSCEGECVVPTGQACTEDRNCGVPNWCNPCTGHCEEQGVLCDACSDSRSCQDDGGCLPYRSGGTFCGRSCVTDAGCPTGYLCTDVVGSTLKQCIARSGTCVDLGICQDDGDCPDEEICNTALGACAPGCNELSGCAGELICAAGRCVTACGSNGDCDGGKECDTTSGRCKAPGACETRADCPDAATHCDRVDGMCKDGCLADADCKDAAMKCEGRACVPKGCEHNYQCQHGHECDKTNGACVPSPDPHCADCGEGAATACDAPNVCAEVTDQNDVSQGQFCFLLCKDDPVDKCPQGYSCVEIETDQGVSHHCFRECWYDPAAP